jgi:predicted secreted protein with PEFG-CTERM motif
MIVLFTVAILSVSALGNNAYANHVMGGGGTIDVVAAEGSNTISINGTTDKSDEIIIKVLAPNRNLVSIDQITPSDGSYSTTIKTSALWNQDGDYTITVQQSNGACKTPDSNWSGTGGNTNTETSCGQQFMENKYNHLVRVEVISGTTSATSISIDVRVIHDEEFYISNQNMPTTPSLKKLTITATGIEGSNTINVSGTTDRSDEIIIKVLAPNGNLVSVDQITPTAGIYSTAIETGGPLWSQDGMYMITASQAPTALLKASSETFSRAADSANSGLINYQTSAEVEILDGYVIPEFGVIAAMILAVAIVSIIVVTAKTKLSIVPRY